MTEVISDSESAPVQTPRKHVRKHVHKHTPPPPDSVTVSSDSDAPRKQTPPPSDSDSDAPRKHTPPPSDSDTTPEPLSSDSDAPRKQDSDSDAPRKQTPPPPRKQTPPPESESETQPARPRVGQLLPYPVITPDEDLTGKGVEYIRTKYRGMPLYMARAYNAGKTPEQVQQLQDSNRSSWSRRRAAHERRHEEALRLAVEQTRNEQRVRALEAARVDEVVDKLRLIAHLINSLFSFSQ